MKNSKEHSYDAVLTIKDKHMRRVKGEDERVSFEETAQVSGETVEEARVMAIFLAQEIWPANKYDISIKSISRRD